MTQTRMPRRALRVRPIAHALQITRVMLSVYYAYMVEYRAELLFWALSGTFPLIFMGIWAYAAESAPTGLDALTFIRYFLAVFVVRQFTVAWVVWEFEREVVEGKLSPYLLQPIDPVWRHFFSHVSERLARLPFIVALVGLFLLLYPQAAWLPSPSALVLGVGATALAFCLRFLIQYTIAMLTFWTERATAVEQFWYLLYLFLSGMIAPLDLFPEGVRQVVLWTPFPYLIYFPVSLLIGSPVDMLQGVLAILGWGLIFLALNRWLWRRGLRQYSGMGA
ncbi:ABC transporter permease [Leptolyngbya sp. PCC 6406]|uniref:ABC transporter permease n=1 Tax=Leptolyngbya sp. PCC 6406 TaxID=1173264 RepID=UPI0002AC911A|nr:ABC-2 family transporter protein [Leptolyngbya sp. PCC 6406]